MDLENINLWCWIIPLAIGILCGFFGYLIGKGNSKAKELEALLRREKQSNEKLQTALSICEETVKGNTTTEPGVIFSFDPNAAKAAFGKRIKQDDLKIVEGIGPKIESLFHNYEVKTWKALAELTVAKCQEVLDSGGERYRVHDPSSWPMQARMCYENRWEELYRWQEEHLHGKL